MPHTHISKKKSRQALSPSAQAATKTVAPGNLLPIGAMLLAGSMSAMAQQEAPTEEKTLKPVVIKERAEAVEGKDSVRATTTTIGKGKQDLRDIPQSITVVTEKLIDDRNLDTLKEVLHNTAGVTFMAAEGSEEDIRLRGFSLAGTGDIFVDGMRDPAFYDRDTFNYDRIELLRGSASMLFGRGSTGGAVNQVTKPARAFDDNEISTTLGSYNYRRVVGDFNIQTGEDAGLRVNAMVTKADNNGAGSSIDKKGLAATYRFGIGTTDEFSVGLSSLQNNNGMNYGMPWIRGYAGAPESTSTLLPVNPNSYYGMASDYNKGTADTLTFAHTHRFQDDSELKTSVRRGVYTRDQRSGTVRIGTATLANFSNSTTVTRGGQAKMQDLDSVYAQSDFSTKFNALGFRHEVTAGVDMSEEGKTVYAVGGITKPTTTIGAPNNGAWVNEAGRTVRINNIFQADNLGLYAQDLMQVAPHWKVLGGLRYDRMRGNFDSYAASGAVTSYNQTISDWSQRVGLLFQPSELSSFHFSWGTSFNTSADTYSYSALSANTAPEQSRNVEFGAKLDSADKRYTTRFAIFQSVKFNERNTDPDNAATSMLLSGQRHTTGLEIDVSGYLTPEWEVFGSYMWMPDAKIDQAAPTAGAGEREGERPWLTPVHSGTVWTTYQLTSQLRLGGGINFRSEQKPNRNPDFSAPAYATLDLMTEYKFNERYVLKGNLTNVMDKLYADSLYTGHYVPGAGRNLQVTLNIKF